MSRAISYRHLRADEAELLSTIDRAELVDGAYRAANGVLEPRDLRLEVPGWDRTELASHIARLRALIESGGRVFAAWDERRLVGIGSLDPSPVGGDRGVMKLDMLFVSAGYRGRGIARALTDRVASLARSLGARDLYISATPSRHTVDIYLHMGARVLRAPDPKSYELEPEDIHLALSLE